MKRILAFLLLLSSCTLMTEPSSSVENDCLPILWNKLESNECLTNSTIGTALIQGTGTTYISGQWANGIDCSSGNSKDSAPKIPAHIIPAGDFSIEFWYTKTSDFTEGEHASLFYSGDTNSAYSNSLNLQIHAPWNVSSHTLYCIKLGIKISSDNLYLVHDFGDLTTLNDTFPLNTPVHIAVTKRNSDGTLHIYLNDNEVPTFYPDFHSAYTTNHFIYSNLTGFFPFETYLGNINRIITNSRPAKGVIDNLKVYDVALSNFIIDRE